MKPDPFDKTKHGDLSHLLTEGSQREETIVRALQEFQAAIDAGNPIDRSAMLARYPLIQDELSACLDGLELMRLSPVDSSTGTKSDAKTSAQEPLRQVTPAATLGDFRIEREIGKGGMGVVYEAEQLSVGRKVALKVLPYAAMLDKRQVARFQNEARAAATLEHSNIVPVYFVGNERGVHFYAMRLIEGKNLAELLHELRSTPTGQQALLAKFKSGPEAKSHLPKNTESKHDETEETIRNHLHNSSTNIATEKNARGKVYYQSIARLIKQAAEALAFAHSHGIIHRDIKPANILLDDLGDAWVTDFGLARIESSGSMTITGDLIGTLRYMSPEQTLAKQITVDHRSDVYSLGATLYELLTLEPLFHSDDRATLLKKISFDDPKPPSRIAENIPKDLETIVLKALEKNPDDRYASAHDMGDDLGRFLKHEPVQAKRAPLVRRVSLWAQRHPQSAMVIGLALVLSLVLSLGIPEYLLVLQAREQADQLAAQAQEIADSNAARAATLQYFSTVGEIRELDYKRPIGWSWDALEKIQKATKLEADGKDLQQLRSLAASALSAIDVQPLQEFANDVDPGAIAFSKDGLFFAIGEVRPAANSSISKIYLFRLSEEQDSLGLERTFSLPNQYGLLGQLVQRISSGEEGVRSLCFSNDSRYLAVGTRYGQILRWDLTNESRPTEISPAKPDENERVAKLSFSPNDEQLVACINGINVLRIIDCTDPSFPYVDSPRDLDLFEFIAGDRLLYLDPRKRLVEIADLSNPQPREKVTDSSIENVNAIAADSRGRTAVVSVRSSIGPMNRFIDPESLANSLRFDLPKSASQNAYHNLHFGPSDQSVMGVRGGNFLQVWDAISGAKAFSIPRFDTVYAHYAVANQKRLLVVAGSSGASLFRWNANHDDNGISSTHSGEQPRVFTTFAPGAVPIQAFDLSQDGESIAILESHPIRRYTIRTRTFSLHDGAETGKWTSSGRYLKTRGTDVLYTHGGNVVAACKEIGVPLVLNKQGIQVPEGIARRVKTVEAALDEDGIATFTFAQTPKVTPPYAELALGFTFRFLPREDALRSTEPARFKLQVFVDGETKTRLTRSVEPFQNVGGEGWQSFHVKTLATGTTGSVRLEVKVESKDAANDILLEYDIGYLMALLDPSEPPYWLGPMAIEGNGRIMAADDGNTLTCRSTSVGAPEWEWEDNLNEHATIRSIASAEDTTVVGTRWGHVYLVDAERNVRQLNSVGPSDGGDVPWEIASVAMDKRGHVAASGTLEGKVSLFWPHAEKGTNNEVEIQAHPTAITSVSLRRDGKLLASAGEDSMLRLWRVSETGLDLWFEVQLANPVEDLQFSPANERLFMLCRGERGLRILDLDALRHQFQVLGIAEDDEASAFGAAF